MRTFTLDRQIWLDRSPEEIFGFFADAGNLDLLTPQWLRFRIVTPSRVSMGENTQIDYRLRLRGIPLRWRSRITAWEPPFLFVDEQVQGPYRYWKHVHRFREIEGGTLVSDEVAYAVWGGEIVERLLVRPDLARIFDYRMRRLEEKFAPAGIPHVGKR